jgi:hypothetical protein
MAAHAPEGARLANAFNDGPWLVWISAPRIRHYLDPRNNLGAPLLARYVNEVLPDPQRFEAEARREGITLALIRTRDPRLQRLGRYLTDAPGWRLIYWDGHHALYTRSAPDSELSQRFGYRVLHARFDLTYLDGRGPHDGEFERDLAQLDGQSAALATAIRAYRLLRTGDPGSAARAAMAFQASLPELPDAPELLGYWAESLQRAGLGAEGQPGREP